MHIPVLKDEVTELLAPKYAQTILDCTLGLGGHSEAILEKTTGKTVLVGIDADRTNLASAAKRLEQFRQCTFVHANFLELPHCLPDPKMKFDCILADLGLSSPHIDHPSRGFSFKSFTPLDMRYNTERGLTASEWLAEKSAEDMAQVFRTYGEVPRAYSLALHIVKSRHHRPLHTSDDLICCVEEVYGFRAKSFLPQIFQSIRIVVNKEVDALQHLLLVAPELLMPLGRLAIISYHSLEDRLVKDTFRFLCTPTKSETTGAVIQEANFELITKKPVKAQSEEIAMNPRARSALLRVLLRRK